MTITHFDAGDGKACCRQKVKWPSTEIGRDVTCWHCRRKPVFVEKTGLLTHLVLAKSGGLACGIAYVKEAFVNGHVEFSTCPKCKEASK